MLPAGYPRVEWTLRLVGMGIDGQSRSFDVMTISRPDGLGDIANLGLTLAEAKLLLASSAAACRRAGQQPCDISAGLPIVWRDMSREGLAAAPDCDVVRRSQGEASPAGVCGLRLW
jgi:hypothetical protein